MSGFEKLQEAAEEQQLPLTAKLLGDFAERALFEPLAADTGLTAPPASAPEALLQQLVRRGLEPKLVAALWPWFADRPLERGLFAWDVLTGTIWPQDEDDLFAEMTEAATQIHGVLPGPFERGVDLNKHPSDQLVQTFALTPALRNADEQQALEAAKSHALGAFERLRTSSDGGAELFKRPRALESIRSFARLLHLAHLPSLSAVYADYLSRALGHRPAAADLCESYFDARAAERIPADALKKTDLPAEQLADLAQYVLYRTQIATGQSVHAHSVLETAIAKSGSPGSDRTQLVHAELAVQIQEPATPLATLTRIADADRLWRYAARVRVAITAAQSPPDSLAPLEALEDFTLRFGNDWRCWYDALHATSVETAWKRPSCGLLAREALALPHEPAAWKTIITIVGDDDSIPEAVEEIESQLYDQSEL